MEIKFLIKRVQKCYESVYFLCCDTYPFVYFSRDHPIFHHELFSIFLILCPLESKSFAFFSLIVWWCYQQSYQFSDDEFFFGGSVARISSEKFTTKKNTKNDKLSLAEFFAYRNVFLRGKVTYKLSTFLANLLESPIKTYFNLSIYYRIWGEEFPTNVSKWNTVDNNQLNKKYHQQNPCISYFQVNNNNMKNNTSVKSNVFLFNIFYPYISHLLLEISHNYSTFT